MTTLSRRRLLKSAAVAAVASPLTSLFADDAKENPISLGFSLYGMKTLKIADALQACSDIGYDAVELAAMKDWPTAPESLSAADRAGLRKQLDDRHLGLAAIMENLPAVVGDEQHRANLDRLKAACELGHDLSPDKPPVVETILGGKPGQWDEVKADFVRRLRDWAKVGEQTKTIIAVKPHVAGALHTPDGAKWLMGELASPWIKLAFDFSHFRLRNFSLEQSLKSLIGDSAFIHVKDASGTAEKFQFLLPGEGDIDYAAYFKLLKETNYRGPVVVEVSGQISSRPDYDPLAAARKCYTPLARGLASAGLRKPG